MARPSIEINWNVVDEFLEAGCTGVEIASHYGIAPDTFYERIRDEYGIGFAHVQASKRATGDAKIKTAQFRKAANDSDNTMLIWLGKTRLKQTEIPMDVAPLQDGIDYVSEIARLQARLALLEAPINANE
jgi:hypothetical protein